MEIISIEKKTFEELVSRLGQFVKRMDSINRQRGGRRMSDWMDNQDVCQALKISPRTLQTLRDSGRLPHSKINNRMPMSNEVITHKHEWVRGLFSDLDRIAKDAATVADENQPLLGGEHYLTDRELSERLKISRRTLQDYRNNGILPYRQLGGKILYRESDIERVLQSCYRGKF